MKRSRAAAAGAGAHIYVTSLHPPGARAPLCHLLEVHGVRILLDCGWSEGFDAGALAALHRHLSPPSSSSDASSLASPSPLLDVDAVLLSHSSIAHLGGLPYLVGRLGSRATIYATAPVHRMGQLALYDALLSRAAVDSEFAAISLDDIDDAFRLQSLGGRFVTLRYLEALTVTGRARAGAGAGEAPPSVSISAVAAGNSLGAAVWQIACSGGDDRVVYAVHYNLRAERHLPKLLPAQLERRPTLLITDAGPYLERGCAPLRAHILQPLPRAAAAAAAAEAAAAAASAAPAPPPPPPPGSALDSCDQALLAAVLAPPRSGGSVLLPSDSNGRALELLMRLERLWAPGFPPLVYLSVVGENTLDFARCMLEYMSERLTRTFVDDRAAPFALKFARVLSSALDVEALMDGRGGAGAGAGAERGPVVVICAFGSLESGAARTLFCSRFAADARSAVIFTDRLLAGATAAGGATRGSGGDDRSLAEVLLTTALPATLDVLETERVPLHGAELRAWQVQAEAARLRAARAAAEARLAENERRGLRDAAEAGSAAAAAADAAAAAAAAAAVAALSVEEAAAVAAAAAAAVEARSSDDEFASLPPRPQAALLYVEEEADDMVDADVLALEQGEAPLHHGLRAAAAHAAAGGGRAECPLCPLTGRRPPLGAASAVSHRVFPTFRSLLELQDDASELAYNVLGEAAASAAVAPAGEAAAPGLSAPVGGSDDSSAASIVSLWSSTASGAALLQLPAPVGAAEAAARSQRRPPPAAGRVPQTASSAAAAARSQRVRAAISERLGRLLPGIDHALDAPAGNSAAAGASAEAAAVVRTARAAGVAATIAEAAPGADASIALVDGVPTKLQRVSVALYVACRVSFLELGGRVDAAAAANLAEEVAPQTALVVGGGARAPAVRAAAAELAARGSIPRVLAALHAGERLAVAARDAVVTSYASNALFSRLKFERVGPVSAVFFAGAVDARSVLTVAPAAAGAVPYQRLLLAPDPDALAAHYHAPIAVHAGGATRVAQLLRALSRAGLRAAIVDGGLVTSGGIVVRRPPPHVAAVGEEDGVAAAQPLPQSAPPALLLEGPLSAEFFAARAAVLASFKVL